MLSKVEHKTRPEIQLLLHCARTKMEPQRAHLVHDLLRQNLNWEYLIQEATRHVVRPLLYNNLQILWSDPEAKELLSNLHEYYCNNTARNLFLANELVRLIQLLGQQGIPAVPYKGPLLAASVYGSLSLREFADLDIFVHKQDVMRVKKILLMQGYQLLPSENREAFYLKHKYHFPFLHPETRILVEIHWTFTKRFWSFDFDPERLWERLQPATLVGASVWNFSVEDLLLILCMHGTKHRWERLVWICDIVELIHGKEDLDWDWILEQAKRIGSLRVLFIGLSMASDLLETVLPDQVVAQMHVDKVARSIASDLQEQIFCDVPKSNSAFYFIRTRERLRDKTRAFLHYLRVRAQN